MKQFTNKEYEVYQQYKIDCFRLRWPTTLFHWQMNFVSSSEYGTQTDRNRSIWGSQSAFGSWPDWIRLKNRYAIKAGLPLICSKAFYDTQFQKKCLIIVDEIRTYSGIRKLKKLCIYLTFLVKLAIINYDDIKKSMNRAEKFLIIAKWLIIGSYLQIIWR